MQIKSFQGQVEGSFGASWRKVARDSLVQGTASERVVCFYPAVLRPFLAEVLSFSVHPVPYLWNLGSIEAGMTGLIASPLQLVRGARLRAETVAARYLLKSAGVEVGVGIRCYGLPLATLTAESRISIGNRVVLVSRSRYTALGVAHQVILRTLTTGAELVIGHDTGLSGTTICAARSVTIGARTLVGADVVISDTDFHPIDPNSRRWAGLPASRDIDAVWIGDDVFIGARTIVLKGVSIGSGAVIGAGSVVTSDIPPMTVAAGVPARALREVTKADLPTEI